MSDQHSAKHDMSPMEMLNELIQQGYLVAAPEDHQPIMPTAYRYVPTITKSGTGSGPDANRPADAKQE